VKSTPMTRPVGPTRRAARNASKPPLEPKSKTISPRRSLAQVTGIPQPRLITASAGTVFRSSSE
jgi:hypothetical protein